MQQVRYLSYCVFCFARDACAIRFTKHNKPYLHCPVCMSRAFLNRTEALRGASIVPELIKVYRSGDESTRNSFEELFRETTSYVRRTVAGRGLAEAPEPVPYTPDAAGEEVA